MEKSKNSAWQSKWHELLEAFKKWSLQSTLHGFSNVIDTNRTTVRIMWLICILTSIGLCSFLTINSFVEYFKYETSSNIEITYDTYTTFPSINLCPSNFFLTKELVLDYLKNKTNMTIQTLDELKKVYNFKNGKLKEDILELRDIISSPYFSDQNKRAIGFSYSEFFISCQFNSLPCSASNIVWYFDFAYGNCYRINTGYDSNGNAVDLLRQYEGGGQGHGLALKLFTGGIANDLRNYFNIQETFGLVVSIDNQTHLPMSNVENILRIKAGTCSYVGLTKTSIKKLPSPYSECVTLESFKSLYHDEFLKLNLTYNQHD
jgi:hypothetical protein